MISIENGRKMRNVFMHTLKNNRVFLFVKDMIVHFIHDDVTSLSAQLAYYMLLSIFPFFIFLVTLLGFLPISTEGVLDVLEVLMPGSVTDLLISTLEQLLNTKRSGLLVISLIGTLWAASSALNAVIYALNKAYDVPQERSWLFSRFLSIVFTVGMVLAILITLIFPVFGTLLEKIFIQLFGVSDTFLFIWSILRWAISFIYLVFLFTLLYYFAPNRKVALKHILVGANVAAIGWIVVSFGFSYYITNFKNYSLTYGSLGGVIILMVWFYLSGMIVIVGGQLNAQLERTKTP
ncbi:MAG TPA: hypothetical protein DDY49_15060 [Paenibacillaceae bacterium]|nr:hypothetical protein [Paenibacillaceae bacterium]